MIACWLVMLASYLVLQDHKVVLMGVLQDEWTISAVRIVDGEPAPATTAVSLPGGYGSLRGHIYPSIEHGIVAGLRKVHADFKVDHRVMGLRPNGTATIDLVGEVPVPVDHGKRVLYAMRCPAATRAWCFKMHNVDSDPGAPDLIVVEDVQWAQRTSPLKIGENSVAWFDPRVNKLEVAEFVQSGLASIQSHDVPCLPRAYSRLTRSIVCESASVRKSAFLYVPSETRVVARYSGVDGIAVGYLPWSEELLVVDRRRSIVAPKEIATLFAVSRTGRERVLIKPFFLDVSTLTFF